MPIQTRNPFTNKVEKTFEEMNEHQIKIAIDRAHQAFKAWRETGFSQRARPLHKVAEILRARKAEFAKLPSIEMGKLWRESRDWEVPVCADIADFYAHNAEKSSRCFCKSNNSHKH